MALDKNTKKLLVDFSKAEQGILAVLLFGSRTKKQEHAFSDYDICLVIPRTTTKERARLLFNLSGRLSETYDLKVFEDLPIMLKGEVIKNNETIYVKDDDELFEYLWHWKKIYDDFQYQYRLAYATPLERLKKWKQKKK